MQFHLPKYVIEKYVFMSFCLQNMALRNMSFCHSVFKIWHWEIRPFVILSIEY